MSETASARPRRPAPPDQRSDPAAPSVFVGPQEVPRIGSTAAEEVRRLASWLNWAYARHLPKDVKQQGRRALLNVVALAIQAQDHEITCHLNAMGSRNPVVFAPLIGSTQMTDVLTAAAASAAAANIEAFDDTHLPTLVHPSAVAMGAAWAVAAVVRPTGNELLRAFVLGAETSLRVGMTLQREHYSRGWQSTGTCGTLGAAVTAGLLWGLDDTQLAAALAVAAGQMGGMRAALGEASRGLSSGWAAARGVYSAAWVRAGGNVDLEAMFVGNGTWESLAEAVNPSQLGAGLGNTWLFRENRIKAYPGAVLYQSAVAAALNLSKLVVPTDLVGVEVHCHPLLIRATGNGEPASPAEAGISTAHAVAATLIRGHFGLADLQGDHLTNPAVMDLRKKITLVPDLTLPAGAISLRAVAKTAQGGVRMEHVDAETTHLVTDEDVVTKARALIGNHLPQEGTTLWNRICNLDDTAESVDALVLASTGGKDTRDGRHA